MKKPVYFMIDKALEVKQKIFDKVLPEHSFYGGVHLEKEGMAKIEDYTLKNIFRHKPKSIVVTNRLKHILLIRLLGQKIILVNMNSNHDLTKRNGIKNFLKYYYNFLHYRLCNQIICLSKIQIPKLREIGVKKMNVIFLGVDKGLIDTVNLKNDYFISSGLDKGKDFEFVKDALRGFNLKILDGKKPLPYKEYLAALGKSKALVFKLDVEKEGSSDLSGSTTIFEGLLMKKIIFINELPWLEELYRENYYVYKNPAELRRLLSKNIKFKEIDYTNITLDYWTKELVKIINTF